MATALENWTAGDVIEWIKKNLSTKYHGCIEGIQEHDIDGQLLKECLNDKDAKTSLLQVLYPNSSDAFLRLSFMRKIEKFEQSLNDEIDINMDDKRIMSDNNKTASSQICTNCGATISSLLIENHERHCIKQLQQETDDKEDEEKEIQHLNEEIIAQIEQNIDIECEFCEIGFNISLIDEHRIYCGSRTEKCHKCGLRDTLIKFKNNQHQCYDINQNMNDINNNIITFNNESLDINNKDNELWISSFERHLYDLEKILHDRFVVDYNDSSSIFKEYDAFGNKVNNNSVYKQKSNQNVSKVRTFHASNNDITNESRHKFEKVDIYKGKSKDELRKEYDEKFKTILNLLQKILENIINEPLNKKYRILKCNNKKLKSLIFSYSSCCEFLKLCDFIYVSDEICYKLLNANNAKLKIGIGVIKYVRDSFNSKAIKQDYEQNKWELNQAYIKNESSIFHGSWSCKKCNHLNRKTSICKKCKTKKKHSLIKEKKQRMEIPLSVERWICGICGNRNAIQLKQCDNCKKDKTVSTKQYQQYHQSNNISLSPQNNQNNINNNNDNDDLYLEHDEWM